MAHHNAVDREFTPILIEIHTITITFWYTVVTYTNAYIYTYHIVSSSTSYDIN